MSDWLEKIKKQFNLDRNTVPIPDESRIPPYFSVASILGGEAYSSKWTYDTATATIAPQTTTTTVTVPSNPSFIGTINIGQSGMASNINIPTTYGVGTFGVTQQQPTHIIQFNNQGAEIVRLEADGKVVWKNGIEIDEAAEAFSKSLRMGAEQSAGITKRIKLEMRDSVFNDIIAIAKEKGSLTAEDLTFLLEASKIVEKLKGNKE